MSTPHPRAFADAARHGQALRSWYMVMFQVPGLAERVVRPGTWSWSQLMRGLPKEAVDRYTARMNDPTAFQAALTWYRAAAAERRHRTVRIGDVAVPTLMFWGDRDPALGRWAAEHSADHVTGPYQFEVVAGAGHWLPEKRAAEMAPVLLEHLAAHPAAS
jgi:pimeloyl-ACP methyl ester carboxylesterase